jgi:hypothetical protein
MNITNPFLTNLHITDASGDYKNDCYRSALTSGSIFELVDVNLYSIDLLYQSRLSFLIEFYYTLFFLTLFSN